MAFPESLPVPVLSNISDLRDLVAKGEPFVVDGAIDAFGWCARASRLSLCA